MRWVLILAAALLLQGRASAQERTSLLQSLTPAERAVVQAWLERDCSVGPSDQQLAQLRALRGPSPDVLLEAYRQGPSPELERAYAAAFSSAYDARGQALARDGARLFGPQDAAALKSVDRTAYVQRRLQTARLNYRTNAVLGLGALRARAALPVLQQISADRTNPLRAAALRSIALIQQPATPARK